MNGLIGTWGTVILIGSIFAATGLASGQPFAIVGLIVVAIGLTGALSSQRSAEARSEDRQG